MPFLDQLPHRSLHVGNDATSEGVGAKGFEPTRVLLTDVATVAEGPALESLLISARRQREPEGQAVRADPGRSVKHQPPQELAETGSFACGQCAEERVRDERRLLQASRFQECREPIAECLVEPKGRLGLSQAGRVGDDEAVGLRQVRQHRRPAGTAAFNRAVQEDERRARSAFKHHGRANAQPQPPLGEREPGQHSLPVDVRHSLDARCEQAAGASAVRPNLRPGRVGTST